MGEKIDPYFEKRLKIARGHAVIKSIEIRSLHLPEAKSNKELPHPEIQGAIADFGWSEKSVDNIMHALETKRIKIKFFGPDRIRIEFLPIEVEDLPKQLGHVAEIEDIRKNLKEGNTFKDKGSRKRKKKKFTYLQTIDFAVEGYIDDESKGKEYGRVYVDSKILADKRNVYIDPESLNITDYEYGYSYCVQGGVPFEAIARIDIIKARQIFEEEKSLNINDHEWIDNPEQYMKNQAARLKKYLEEKLAVK